LATALAEHGDAEVSLKWRWCTDGEELVELRLLRVEPDSSSLQVATVKQLSLGFLECGITPDSEDLTVGRSEHGEGRDSPIVQRGVDVPGVRVAYGLGRLLLGDVTEIHPKQPRLPVVGGSTADPHESVATHD